MPAARDGSFWCRRQIQVSQTSSMLSTSRDQMAAVVIGDLTR